MITALNLRNAHLHGALLPKMFDFRHRVFIEETGYNVFAFDGMEYDRYDTPATVYFVSQNEAGGVDGVVRAAPTDRPYMIEEVWPGLIRGELPKSPTLFEASRIGIDNTISYAERRRVRQELVLAKMEFGLAAGVSAYIGVMPVKFWQSVYRNAGWPVRYLGDPLTLPDGMEVWAGEFAVGSETLDVMRATTGVSHPVLTTSIEELYKSRSLRQCAFNAVAGAVCQAASPITTYSQEPVAGPAPRP